MRRFSKILNIILMLLIAAGIITVLAVSFGTLTPYSGRVSRYISYIDDEYPGFSEKIPEEHPDVKIYSFTVKDPPRSGEALFVWMIHADARIYVDNELFFDSVINDHGRLSKSPGQYWAIVPLLPEDLGKEVRVEVRETYNSMLYNTPVMIVSAAGNLISHCASSEWPAIVVGMFCIVLGAVYAALAHIMQLGEESRRRADFIGIFLALFGLYRVADMPVITLLFNDHSLMVTYISLICFTWIPAAFYLSESNRQTYNMLYRSIGLIFAVLAFVLLLLQVLGIRDFGQDSDIVFICMFLSFIVVLIDYVYGRWVKHGYSAENYRIGMFLLVCASVILDYFLYYRNGNTRNANIALYVVCVYGLAAGFEMVRRIRLRNDEVTRQRMELAERKGAIMVSQMKPHFIYNTMNTIYSLCDINIESAKQAIHDFSGYLRHHFRSMERIGPVSFDEELEHTRFYLSIEKMRFGDALNVEYDIEENDFELPPLSLQPIAENAVRHGIREKSGSGTVTIRSYRTDDACVVEVKDDGAGFDTSILGDLKPDSEHNRIALRNVSVRVEQMCQGQLKIDSTPGEGTVVTISIPIKKDA